MRLMRRKLRCQTMAKRWRDGRRAALVIDEIGVIEKAVPQGKADSDMPDSLASLTGDK